jgi:hypothetical protein
MPSPQSRRQGASPGICLGGSRVDAFFNVFTVLELMERVVLFKRRLCRPHASFLRLARSARSQLRSNKVCDPFLGRFKDRVWNLRSRQMESMKGIDFFVRFARADTGTYLALNAWIETPEIRTFPFTYRGLEFPGFRGHVVNGPLRQLHNDQGSRHPDDYDGELDCRTSLCSPISRPWLAICSCRSFF